MTVPSSPRPFRFGVTVRHAPSREAWRATTRRAEEAGFDVFLVPEHLSAQLVAPVPALLAAAEATVTLRIGTFVLANDFHHPAVLQKALAPLDVLTGGRLEIGLGAGWARGEFEQAGIPFQEPGTRMERLAESVAIITGVFAPEPLSYHGTHFQIDNLAGSPPPVQRFHPPIFIGGALASVGAGGV
jgi:probable F420-dependent oxidoreductase